MKIIIVLCIMALMFDSCGKKANYRCYTNVWDTLGNAIPMDYVGDKYFASDADRISYQQSKDYTCIAK